MCIQFTNTCPGCHGTGVHGHKCNTCHGSGILENSEQVHIRIPPAPSSLEMRSVGDGDAALNHRPGDFVFRIKVKEHPHYVPAENFHHLVYNIDVPLEKARRGFSVETPGLRMGAAETAAPQVFQVEGDPNIELENVRTAFIPYFTAIGGLYVNCRVVP